MKNTKANTKLVFLYGPPGVGKLTVAKELAKLTGFKLFHNHLTVDLVHSIFEFGEEVFHDFVRRYREELIFAATERKISCIFTFVYDFKEDDHTVDRLLRGVEKRGGKVLFVQLTCKEKELYRRVQNPSRRPYRKVKQVSKLKKIMQEMELNKPIPFRKGLSIDNTRLSAKKTAEIILEHYKLPKTK